ncbi:MAG: MAPEG family protein [Blastomonas fulva]|uniref:MAPEG family protein n=1 Tax=Blastomonas fulva TaxID=1550728 RepID=UPI0040336D3E
MSANILTPAAVLVLWSLVMLFWMAGTRLPAAKKIGVDISQATGGRGSDLDPALPPQVAWKSHNYAHLMEQPTIFYATIAIIAIAGAGTDGLNVALAWGYALIRIVHSIWQATVNKVQTRFLLFLASTLCLIVLAVRALLATL